nr:hypothetical protein [Tanacetum cinerariifolium]
MSLFNQRECLGCGQPCDGLYCYLCTCQQYGVSLTNRICLNFTYRDGKPLTFCECEGPLRGGFCWFCDSRAETSFAYDPNPNSFDDSQNLSDYPPQPQYESNPCELCGNDSHYGYDCPPCNELWIELRNELLNTVRSLVEMKLQQEEQAAKLITHTPKPSRRFNSICYDDDDDYDYKESTIPLNEINSQIPPSIVITTSPPDPEDSLIIGNEDLSTILKKESNELINSSVKDLVLIPSKSEDTSGNDSECILPSCDDLSPINIPKEKTVTFSNPLFNSNDDFISSDDESLSDEDVSEDNVKNYLNPLFKFDDKYIASDVNPLFAEVLENIESKDSYDSNLDEPDLLVTPLFDANKDECFDPGGDDDETNVVDCEDNYYESEGDILYLESLLNDDLVHHDLSIPAMSVASILEGLPINRLSKRMMICLI